jgi:hypothetical protein
MRLDELLEQPPARVGVASLVGANLHSATL